MKKNGQGTRCTKMGANILTENNPTAQNLSAQELDLNLTGKCVGKNCSVKT